MSYEALRGVRVVDLGIVTAGASTSALLADLGAEVIKVEGPSYTDPFREWTGINEGTEWWNESPQFQATNRNKRSVCLDLKSDAGLSLFMSLVAQSDVVLENFRTGVLEKLKIDFKRLLKANPKIILASISSQGQTGPECAKSSFGSTLEASSGMASLMRYAGGRPHITGRGMNYPDQVASLFSASAIMAALVERRRSGQGIALDLSQRELTAFLIGEALIAASMSTSLESYPTGTPAHIEGLFEAADGQWVAVTIASADPAIQLDSAAAPLNEASLQSWVAERPAREAASRLRQKGAAAEVVWSAGAGEDPDAIVLETAFAVDTEGHQVKGLPIRLGNRDCGAFRAAPTLGKDNEAAARELMGCSLEEYKRLAASDVFSDRPRKAAKTSS